MENFAGAMRALAELRAPVDAFFDKVTVNADDPELRKNRLYLLSEIRAQLRTLPTSPRSPAKPPQLPRTPGQLVSPDFT